MTLAGIIFEKSNEVTVNYGYYPDGEYAGVRSVKLTKKELRGCYL